MRWHCLTIVLAPSSGWHLHACRRACMALKLHKILAPMLQVRLD
jgi:hypothetical protein